MTTLSISMMILICGVIWGGFAALLLRAVKYEGRKGESRIED